MTHRQTETPGTAGGKGDPGSAEKSVLDSALASSRPTLNTESNTGRRAQGRWPWVRGTPTTETKINSHDEDVLDRLANHLPGLVEAVRSGWVSFDDLTDAEDGKDMEARTKKQKQLRDAYIEIYPLVRRAFVGANGDLIDLYPSPKIHAYAALTRPPAAPRRSMPGLKPDFFFVYDLAATPIASDMFSRISQLAYDAKRIVRPRHLAECLDQLYSAATDFIGIIEEHTTDSNAYLENLKLEVVKNDLEQVELRYLQTAARLYYLGGVLIGAFLAFLVALGTGRLLGASSVSAAAVTFASVGATLSVVQRISDDTLVVKYVTGRLYLCLVGLARPVIGAFAGLLLQLAIDAGLIPVTISGAAGQAFILLSGFAVGWTERSIPDIFSRAGFSRGLPSGSTTATSTYVEIRKGGGSGPDDTNHTARPAKVLSTRSRAKSVQPRREPSAITRPPDVTTQ